MGLLYVTYSLNTDKGTGVGRSTVEANWTGSHEPPLFRWSELQTIEARLLETAKKEHPTASNLFLLDWKWLREEAPSPTSEP